MLYLVEVPEGDDVLGVKEVTWISNIVGNNITLSGGCGCGGGVKGGDFRGRDGGEKGSRGGGGGDLGGIEGRVRGGRGERIQR